VGTSDYLRNTKRSEVAATRVAQPQVPPSEKWKHIRCFQCVPSHIKTKDRSERKKSGVVGIEENESEVNVHGE
jgi:hypothetical protein